MTDNEIKKALECCSKDDIDCEQCPANGLCDNDDYCFTGAILDLINRLQATIDSFTDIGKLYSEIKAEAYKECIEKVKEISNKKELVTRFDRTLISRDYEISEEKLNNLLKELVGDK